MALTYLTPLFYSEEAIDIVLVRQIIRVNPMYWFVTVSRDLILYQKAPEPMAWLICSAWAVGFMLLGLVIFKQSQNKFILHI